MVYWLNVASARSALRLLKCSSSLADATQSFDLRARARLISLTTSASPVRDCVSPRLETSSRTPARCKNGLYALYEVYELYDDMMGNLSVGAEDWVSPRIETAYAV